MLNKLLCEKHKRSLEPMGGCSAHIDNWYCPDCYAEEMEAVSERYKIPPCLECGAETQEEAETMCRCSGDKDHCHGADLWPDA